MDNEQSHRDMAGVESYQGFAGLPPLVGLHTMKEAISQGLNVGEAVERLKRLHWSLKRLHGIFTMRLTSMPIYELKMAFSLHAYYCAEHVQTLATRVREMRQPPHGLETSPSAALDLFFDEVLAAPTVEALVTGIYGRAVPAVVEALENLLADNNRLLDFPSYRVGRLALVELRDVQEYGEAALRCLVSAEQRANLKDWLALLDGALGAAGTLDGDTPSNATVTERHYSQKPYRYDPIPRRDERFKDSYNMGVNAEEMLFDGTIPPLPKLLMMYYKRMREIDVPEMMSSILAEQPDKPWEYKRDLTRQLWDEARHAMMGETGFVSLGVDWTEVPLNFTWSLGMNTKLSAKERHAVLYTIEQGLMPRKTGKEYEWRVALATSDPLAARIQDYDWADEVLHARIGREWLVPEVGTQVEALAFGDKAWSRILGDWAIWRDQGLTDHRNWWPDIYRKACARWGIEPDPEVLAYDRNYATTRADLKQVSV